MKSPKFKLLHLLLLLSLSCPVFAQLSQSALYYAKVGSSDFIAGIGADGQSIVLFVFGISAVDSGSAQLGTSKSGTFTSSGGARVVYQVTASTVSGTYAGTAFTLQRESPLGPQSSVAGYYQGALYDYRTGNSYLVDLTLLASGRIFFDANSTRESFSGFGSLNANGSAVIRVPGKYQLSFPFAFDGDTLFQPAIASAGLFDYRIQLARTKGSTLVNVSTRANVASGQQMIAGFVITGGEKMVLIRAIGPTLRSFGVTNANTDPTLQLYSGGDVIATNDNWGDNANAADIPTANSQAGAFALVSGSKDAVLLVNLKPGSYSAVVSSVGTATGDALIEVYEFTR